MIEYTDRDFAEASGELSYRAPKPLELNEVLINGNADIEQEADGTYTKKGGYFRKRIWVGRKNKDAKPEEVNLGSSINVVFLKIRRKLMERSSGGEIVRSTSEHTSTKDVVGLYETATKNSTFGIAEDIRKRYMGLRTVQTVYALLLPSITTGSEPELVRITIKGSSLGSDAKPEGVLNFYQYITSFPKDEHIYDYETVLSPVLEKGQKSYYAIKFESGKKLSPEVRTLARTKLMDLHLKCKELDESVASKMAKPDAAAETNGEGDKSFEYPTEEINPLDMAF